MRVVSSKRGGFTLIEVIIAMAIFVIGAVAIVRIFPPALAALQGSQDRSNATRLASSQIERFRLRGANTSVPDAIYSTNVGGGFDAGFAGAFNGTKNSNQSLPRDVRSSAETALDKGRYIDGERQRVMKDGNGVSFLLTDFPYDAATSVAVKIEDTLEGVRIENATALPVRKYVFDFSGATSRSTGNPVALQADPNIRYYISYRWVDNAGRINSVVDEPYSFSGTTTDEKKVARDEQVQTNAIASIIEGEVDARVVRQISTTPQVEDDDEFRGLYRFTGGISAGSVVQVSYQVAFSADAQTAGWRGLVIDQAPANNGVTLSTRGLDDENFDGDTVYGVVYDAPDASGNSNDTLRRGNCLPKSDGTCTYGATSHKAFLSIKSSGNETNRVEFDADADGTGRSTPLDPFIPRARVMYRPQDGWGVQVSVAARSYMPFVGFTLPGGNGYKSEPWREYIWKNNESSLYFQPSETGKTVLVSYEYLDGITKKHRFMRDAVINLNDRIESSPVATFGAGSKASTVVLTDANGNSLVNKAGALPDDSYVTAILAVRGASVQARTVWADNQGRYSQTVVTDYRKRD